MRNGAAVGAGAAAWLAAAGAAAASLTAGPLLVGLGAAGAQASPRVSASRRRARAAPPAAARGDLWAANIVALRGRAEATRAPYTTRPWTSCGTGRRC